METRPLRSWFCDCKKVRFFLKKPVKWLKMRFDDGIALALDEDESRGNLKTFARIILSLSLVASLAACGDSSGDTNAIHFNAQSVDALGIWNLVSIDDVAISANDPVVLDVVELDPRAMTFAPDCTGVISAQPNGAKLDLIDDGVSSNGCFVTFPHDSNHSVVAGLLQMKADFQVENSTLLLIAPSGSVYKFQK